MSAFSNIQDKQQRGEPLTSIEFAVWWCSDVVAARKAAEELAAKDAELSALRAEAEALKWVVKRLEYIEESDEYLLCPICRGEKPTHYEDCELAAALNAPSEGQKRE